MPNSYSVLKEHLLCCTLTASSTPAPSCSNCTAIPGNSWEQSAALSARFRQCHVVWSAYKILHLAAQGKWKGHRWHPGLLTSRKGAEVQQQLWGKVPVSAWHMKLWGALQPLLLCVCINTHCSDNNLKHSGNLDGKKPTHRSLLVTSQCSVADTVCTGSVEISKIGKSFQV